MNIINQTINKKKYVQPFISIHLIFCDGSIAIGSSSITPIGSTNDNDLEVLDWQSEDKGSFDVDL